MVKSSVNILCSLCSLGTLKDSKGSNWSFKHKKGYEVAIISFSLSNDHSSNLGAQEHGLDNTIKFKWKSLKDVGQESCITICLFEVLSVLHMMAIMLFSEANSLLVRKNLMDTIERNLSE
ncbi:hypothetical protein GIB67_002577, partial [Kingdonia uniflora]